MKHILLFLTAFLFSTLAAVHAHGSTDTDCSDFNGINYSHCTHFIEQLPDPFEEGYMMQLYYKLPDGTTTPILIELCMNSNVQLDINYSMIGEYTEYYKIGYWDESGELYFEDHAQQTILFSGYNPAAPAKHAVFIDSAKIPVTCEINNATLTLNSSDALAIKVTHQP